jgi:hypothetical protein
LLDRLKYFSEYICTQIDTRNKLYIYCLTCSVGHETKCNRHLHPRKFREASRRTAAEESLLYVQRAVKITACSFKVAGITHTVSVRSNRFIGCCDLVPVCGNSNDPLHEAADLIRTTRLILTLDHLRIPRATRLPLQT